MTQLSDIEKARFNMVEQQIRPWDVLNQAVLDLLFVVKREHFVPAAYRNLAFADLDIPLPGGENMLAPKMEARILQELQLNVTDRILEVGTGSGYMAALLAARSRGVVSIEVRPELKAFADANLTEAGITKVKVESGNGLDPAHPAIGGQTFDAIVLSGSVPEVPAHLLERLASGGRLIAFVGTAPVMQAVLVTRKGDKSFETVHLFETAVKPLVEARPHSRFSF
jgi:protein-L-isoaspartate(D-aspartate) O-methyltransferase